MSFNAEDYLMHHGILGQKWYRRRWQNEDGSLTPAGRIHYGVGLGREKRKREENNLSKSKSLIKKFSDKTKSLHENSITKDELPINKELKELVEAARDLDKYDERDQQIRKEFFSDKKTYAKYIDKLIDEHMKTVQELPSGVSSREEYRSSLRDFVMNETAEYNDYAYEDYLLDKQNNMGAFASEYSKAYDRNETAKKAYVESITGKQKADNSTLQWYISYALPKNIGDLFTDEELKDL